MQGNAQRFALPALGRGRRSRPTGKMLRRGKLLEICAESPASGSIIKSGHGRSMSGRSQQDRRAAGSPCPLGQEPEQLQGHKDRILAWAPLHYTKRRSE